MKNENTAEKKEYGNLRIVSLDGSQIYRRADSRCGFAPYSTLKDGKLNPDAFGGILDESLDTDKLCEVYEKHKAEMPFAYTEDGNYTRALVSVSFDYAVAFLDVYKRVGIHFFVALVPKQVFGFKAFFGHICHVYISDKFPQFPLTQVYCRVAFECGVDGAHVVIFLKVKPFVEVPSGVLGFFKHEP